ncbi:SLC13 family permease [Halanaeroarchaeum sulfurireducens]|uniref:DASS family transporter n=1 Tax=Halanaeroarchaeum sulfurireducens TaxID=1604004 RepID=A0A0N9N740_9EURY|nr:SLC13 family permease [Halanaeroarchaeum sulfurireducens]ALG82836.1 DASS family transporter [Halanaeroarchaeum sulfurireducens]
MSERWWTIDWTRERVGLVLGPAAFGFLLAVEPFGLSPPAVATLAGTVWIATWWVTEAIPIPATSLLPVVLFPLSGVVDVAGATAPYANPLVFLLLGGFLLAVAIERWNLHRRLALASVAVVGVQTDRLLLGFMLSTAFLSMWISNSATAMVMVPIGIAVVVGFAELDEDADHTPTDDGSTDRELIRGVNADPARLPATSFGLALMLGIAYSATIGGVATLIGSPPNAVFAGVARARLGVQIDFLDWMLFAGPLSIAFLFVAWFLLLKLLDPPSIPGDTAQRVLDAQREDLGPISRGERRVAIVFALVAAAWLLRPFVLQPIVPAVTDAVIAIAGGLLLFTIPADRRGSEFLLDWTAASRVPWGVLVLLGGGFSLANAFQESGLDLAIARAFGALGAVPLLALLFVVAVVVVFLTEVTSNTATATVFMPIMASLGAVHGISPLPLMGIVALAASFAFMLPVATPPNAVVFGSGYVTVPQMSRVGVWLNLVGIVAIVALTYLWLPVAVGLMG